MFCGVTYAIILYYTNNYFKQLFAVVIIIVHGIFYSLKLVNAKRAN